MKHNLKTIKKCWDTADEYGCLQKELVGFERELREKYSTAGAHWEFYNLIKEILGE